MARITIEDCLEKVPSRFQLVHMAAKRVRQIREGSEYLVNSPKNEDRVFISYKQIPPSFLIAGFVMFKPVKTYCNIHCNLVTTIFAVGPNQR